MKRLKKSAKGYWIILMALMAGCTGPAPTDTKHVDTSAAPSVVLVPAALSYEVVNTYPHDPTAFTEGLEYKDGFLYESTGEYGSSDLRKVELKTGKVLEAKKLDDRYFGEGLTILNGKIYQLTYREGKGFVYDLNTLKLEKTFVFDAQEGWGMTNNGAQLIYDDGSNVLHYLDPATFKEVKRLEVMDEHGPVNEINEPELVGGFIYANQWQTDWILKIDTVTGKVVARADLQSLRTQAGIPAPTGNRHAPDVLNGIAFDAAGNRMFITGKNWPKLFEIKLY